MHYFYGKNTNLMQSKAIKVVNIFIAMYVCIKLYYIYVYV